MACRIALHRGAGRVFGIDLVPERLEMAAQHGVETIDSGSANGNVADMLRERTDGRGPDAVIDAVGMEAHGAPFGKLAQTLAGYLPDQVAAKLIEKRRLATPEPSRGWRNGRVAERPIGKALS